MRSEVMKIPSTKRVCFIGIQQASTAEEEIKVGSNGKRICTVQYGCFSRYFPV